MSEFEPKIGSVHEVANAIQLATASDGKGLGKAVFFIGAGCSISAGIPLVADMAKQLACKLAHTMHAPDAIKNVPDEAYRWLSTERGFPDCRQGEAPKDSAVDDRLIDWPRVYDVMFADYYKTPDHAREIFAECVDQSNGQINWAHLCLGELVKQKLVSTVLTTNFDQLTLAGLVRSGVLPVVCDGSESLTRIRGTPLHPQLIELHGSRHTYRLRNSPDEVKALIDDTATIAAIESLFQELRVFVAVGYGGRERGIMQLLIRAASRFTDKQIFWIVHGSDPARISDNARHLLASSRNSAIVLGQDADSFFVRLLKELRIGAPETMREPLFLVSQNASRLASHAPKDIAEGSAISEEISRHREEIQALTHALHQHRESRTATETARVQARELRLAGKLSDALQILQEASQHSNDRALWQQLAEVSLDWGEASPDREPITLAVKAWRKVLADTDRGREPEKWAATQDNLGNALSDLGARESGTKHLDEAVAAYREALKERTRERFPLEWAETQNNLGIALRTLGARESDTARLDEAVLAYREALKERTRERVPLQWAATQNNLGIALRNLSERESGTARLHEAVTAYREALKEYKRERVPLSWAAIQNNLGVALATLREGEGENETARLNEAVAAFRESLKERTRERVPLEWSTTQNNLGNTLRMLGERETGTARLDDAVTALREALKERTRERVPLDWAATQNNLGIALETLGERESGTARLDEAITTYRSALDVFEKAGASYFVQQVRYNLARAQQLLAKRSTKERPKARSPHPQKAKRKAE